MRRMAVRGMARSTEASHRLATREHLRVAFFESDESLELDGRPLRERGRRDAAVAKGRGLRTATCGAPRPPGPTRRVRVRSTACSIMRSAGSRAPTICTTMSSRSVCCLWLRDQMCEALG
jgi:hypothetical protein